MKVKVAAQTLSNSVASAIRFLESLKSPSFENSGSTADFIIRINNLFDILNSKNKFGKAAKQPISLDNIDFIENYVQETGAYLKKLRNSEGNLIHQGRQKTFIVGFLTTAKSILAISRSLLSRESNSFSYVMS